jgi:hypothetical protein
MCEEVGAQEREQHGLAQLADHLDLAADALERHLDLGGIDDDALDHLELRRSE